MLADLGRPVRYRGLGAGIVVGHQEREFRGSQRTFAVIEFPHRDMKAQVPLGDPGVESKLSHVAEAADLKTLIETISVDGGRMLRTWEERERVGTKHLREGGPEEWAQLLRNYARAQSEGVQLAVSDVEMVREAQQMLASELACASGEDFTLVLDALRATYTQATQTAAAELVEA